MTDDCSMTIISKASTVNRQPSTVNSQQSTVNRQPSTINILCRQKYLYLF
ncbi:MAG: hypothetical protein KME64_24600 [Scytonematopsis contorta HA4267-MV1]|nr:hypothetical protein [Scytonematopsis contorta HA4267-MV1]